MQVELKKGETIMIDAALHLPVAFLREVFSDRSGVPLDLFELYYRGKRLEGKAALASCGVAKGSTIEVKMRGRGGMPAYELEPAAAVSAAAVSANGALVTSDSSRVTPMMVQDKMRTAEKEALQSVAAPLLNAASGAVAVSLTPEAKVAKVAEPALEKDLNSTFSLSSVLNGNFNFDDICAWLLKQPWYKGHELDCRVGMGFCGGSLLGVSTSLWHVMDNKGNPVCESTDGKALAKLFDEMNPAMKPHTAKVVWDSQHAADMRSFTSGKEVKPDARGLEAAEKIADGSSKKEPADWLRPEKKALLLHVTDSIGAMARALDQASDEAGGGAFFITNYFALRKRFTQIKRDLQGDVRTSRGQGDTRITPEDFVKQDKVLQLEPPIIMLKRLCATVNNLTLIVPYPEEFQLEVDETFKTWSRAYPSRTTILVPIRNFEITTSFDLLAAITHVTHSTRSVPRPCIVGVASGGYGVLREMAHCSSHRHSMGLISLVGSGRLSDLWAEVWPRRGETLFNPVRAAHQLHEHVCYPPSPDAIQNMHRVLYDGELYLNKISDDSATLERLCVSLLQGNRLLTLADEQMQAYQAASRRYERPRKLLVNLSIILGFATTLIAVLVPESISQQTIKTEPKLNVVLYYWSIVLPALMLVVDQASCPSRLRTAPVANLALITSAPSRRCCQVENYLGTQQSQRACKRAAGLVNGQIFCYKTQTGEYADLAIERATKGSDSATERQLLFAKRLNEIQVNVAASRAQVTIIDKHTVESRSISGMMNRLKAGISSTVGAKGTDKADERSGGECYIEITPPATKRQPIREVGAKGTKEADGLNGDEYIKVRPPAGPQPTVS